MSDIFDGQDLRGSRRYGRCWLGHSGLDLKMTCDLPEWLGWGWTSVPANALRLSSRLESVHGWRCQHESLADFRDRGCRHGPGPGDSLAADMDGRRILMAYPSPGWWPRLPAEVVDGRWLGFSIISTLLTGLLIFNIRILVQQRLEKAWRP